MVVAADDLPELGLRPSPQTSADALLGIRALRPDALGVLPPYLSHVLVVESAAGRGKFYEVRRRYGGGTPEVRPVRRRRSMTDFDDPSFVALRTETLDVVLDVLETRMVK
jgi:hypothetical protein